MTTTTAHTCDHDVAIVGAGPAGIGTAVALEHLDVDYGVLERDCVGSSFRRWPDEMRLLTPSFPGNAFGVRDLNAITPDTSPALALDSEHPTGQEYAGYLEAVAEFHDLPIRTGTDVERVYPRDDAEGFVLETADGAIAARYVVWAAGEFQYPADGAIPGSANAVHVASIDSWARHARLVSPATGESDETSGRSPTERPAPDGGETASGMGESIACPDDDTDRVDDVVVVGGGESGIDAALGLSDEGLSVTVVDPDGPWRYRSPDPSEVLSPRTTDRLECAREAGRPIDLVAETRVERIERRDGDRYRVVTDRDDVVSRTPPVLATGFEGSVGLVDDLFAFERVDGGKRGNGDVDAATDEDENGGNATAGTPVLTDRDESTETPGLFLAGPQVAHDGQPFCFIYKFRQRFAVVAETIGDRLGVDTGPLAAYREKSMFLEDLSCCEPDYCDC
ncbi:NAD(P)/FAD-dependent oxidoreductase [Natrarchaeobaculum aegyptiacum]|uniref:Thioredoxin reductase-like protein n=1 Tax=Natrarchaeobaculum aegyptiacum TaxID=745377 RepID=A0A2Z2HTB3_9EURY|nr:NAD(P)/FAD-dependent oxidoreductase [Natrarchaeobaculum aegyptiacum]ARS89365.1 thioredoxin reductase-like protein [Natrarchaeobaculum aegyptiacum]